MEQNKNIYADARKKAGMTQAKASALMDTISEDRLARIEKDKVNVTPEDILEMAAAYKRPDLCNYYCAHECAIGKQEVPALKISQLSDIVLNMLTSLNAMDEKKNRLIEITADGKITDDEIEDFAKIQSQLDRISILVDTLKLWVNQTLANGEINQEKYKEILAQLNK